MENSTMSEEERLKDKKSHKEWYLRRLRELHAAEDEFNAQIRDIDSQVKELNYKKKVLAIKISKNMKHRNSLIKQMPD